MRKILFLIFCCFQFEPSLAQLQKKIDSLENELKKLERIKLELGGHAPGMNDTLMVRILIKLCSTIKANDPPKTIDYAKQALAISTQCNFLSGISQANMIIGNISLIRGDYLLALESFQHALEAAKQIGDQEDLAGLYNNMGIIQMNQGNYAEALKNYFAALKIAEDAKIPRDIANGYSNIGVIYYRQKEYESALKYYLLGLRIEKSIDNKNGIASSYDKIGGIYTAQNLYDEALQSFREELKIITETGDKRGMAIAYANIGAILAKQGNESEALSNLFSALEIYEAIGEKEHAITSYNNIGEILQRQKKYQDALIYYNKALANSQEIGALEDLANTYLSLTSLDSLFATSNSKNWKSRYESAMMAFQHYKLYTEYQDSLLNEEVIKKTVQLQMKYDFDKREAEANREHEKKELLALNEIKRQKLLRNSLFGIVGVAGIFSFFLVAAHSRKRKMIFEKKVSHVEMKALRSQINPHFIFNSLHSINKYMMDNDKENASEFLTKFARLMRMILENSREQEVPLEKDIAGLELYIQLEALRFQNNFSYRIEIDPEIDKENVMIPPMLLQPFVENSILHGLKGKIDGRITIRIKKEGDMIRCTVEDNGMGREQSVKIESEPGKKRESLGMKITQERLHIISELKKVKADIHILDLKDAENKPMGLRVELLLPYEQAF